MANNAAGNNTTLNRTKIALNIVQALAIVAAGIWALFYFVIIEKPAHKLKEEVELMRLKLEKQRLNEDLQLAEIQKTPISKVLPCLDSEFIKNVEDGRTQYLLTFYLFIANRGGGTLHVEVAQEIEAYLMKESYQAEVIALTHLAKPERWRKVHSGSHFLFKGKITKNTVNNGSIAYIVTGESNTHFMVSAKVIVRGGLKSDWRTGASILLGDKTKCQPYEIMKNLQSS